METSPCIKIIYGSTEATCLKVLNAAQHQTTDYKSMSASVFKTYDIHNKFTFCSLIANKNASAPHAVGGALLIEQRPA